REPRHLRRVRDVPVRAALHRRRLLYQVLHWEIVTVSTRLVLRRVPRVAVHVHPGVLRGVLPVPRVPQQLLLPPRGLRQLHGGMRMRDDLLAIQQH
ncbi:unnamed protein product, partial [Ectocarpus fasciculatus]